MKLLWKMYLNREQRQSLNKQSKTNKIDILSNQTNHQILLISRASFKKNPAERIT